MTIVSIGNWRTNGELIAEVARLGYIKQSDFVLDPTYGRGLWWTEFRPDSLAACDRETHREWDFRTMSQFDDGVFDVVAFDPPYVAQGGRKTIGEDAKDFTDRFGMDDCAATPEAVQHDLELGMAAAKRVLKKRGILLVKCKSYVSSGKLWPGVHLTWVHAVNVLDLEYVDEFTMVAGTGPQPKQNRDGTPRRQVHARQNSSTLFVFRKR